ncbi:MAG: LCP family protein [Actinomycetota bacterium]
MTSHEGNDGAGGDEQPPVDPSTPLPPELNPRGRRAGRAEQRAAAKATATPAVQAAAAAPTSLALRHDLRRGVARGAQALALVLAVAVLATSGWAWWTWRGFKQDITRIDAVGASGRPSKDIDGKDQNILIAGNDDRETATNGELAALGTTRDGGSLNTDTMMLVHLPANGAKATVISMPRDSYVAIPRHGMNKLNSAYPLGVQDGQGSRAAGGRLLVQTIQNLTGLTIDHYVQVDLLGFFRISNAIGGVRVNLCAAQREENSGINLPKGVSTIKGTQALAFVRQRYGLPHSDLDRIKRQQYFLSAVFRKLSSAGVLLNPFKLQNLLTAVTKSLQMDNTLDPLQLARQMSDLTAGNLTFSTIPVDGFEDTDVGNVVVVHPDEVAQFVARVIAQQTGGGAKSAAKPIPASSVTVDVFNGSGADGVATRNANALKQAGFVIGQVETTAWTATTVVSFPAGLQPQAQLVAARVPGAAVTPSDSVSRVTLILGADGRGVGAQSPPANSPAPPAASAITNAADSGACIN